MTKPLVLAVALFAIGGLAYWLEYGRKPKEQQAEADAKKIFVVGKGPVALLEFRGASTKPDLATKAPLAVSLVCESLKDKLCRPDDASKWRMNEPLKTKADDATVNSLFKNIANLVSNEAIDLSAETPEKRALLVKDYGLDAAARANPNTRRISVTLDGGKRFTAYFGVKHPIGENVFALLESGDAANESRIFVVPDWQLSVFDQKTSYFRDKNLFGIGEKEISAFDLAVSKKIAGKLEAKRTSDEKGWRLKFAGSDLEGDADMIEGALSAVVHLAAKDVLAESRDAPAAKTTLAHAKNVYDLKFTTKDGEKRLRLYEKKIAKDPNVPASIYAIVDGQDPVYEVDVYAADKIEKTIDELRIGKLLTVAERYSITSIDIASHGSEAFKQRVTKDTGGQWKVGTFDTSRGKVEALLDRLGSKIVVAHSGPSPSEGLLKMTLGKMVDGKETTVAEIEFWTTRGRLYARDLRAPKKEVVELAPDLNTSLPWKAATLLDEKGAAK